MQPACNAETENRHDYSYQFLSSVHISYAVFQSAAIDTIMLPIRHLLMRNPTSIIRSRYRCGHLALLLSAAITILSVGSIWTSEANQTFGRRDHTTSFSPMKRKIQSWFIRNRSQSRISATMRQRIKHSVSKNGEDRSKKCGSFMTCQSPTKERLYRWYGMEGEEPNQFMRCMMLRNEFNHKICGITNPFLKILTSKTHREIDLGKTANNSSHCEEKRRIFCRGNKRRNEGSVLTSRPIVQSASIALDSSTDIENSWWPSLQISNTKTDQNDGKKGINRWKIFHRRNKNSDASASRSFTKQDWRIRTYRKRVGRGKDCYEKVRDAALDWEFQSADGSTGMMQVPDNLPNDDKFGRQITPIGSSGMGRSYSVQPIKFDKSDSTDSQDAYFSSSTLYRSLGSRRLVSFASKSITEFVPSFLRRRIYSINPVMVVYDVVDQRAPNGKTTFTSTAYSTLKGHFLSGEERVTVALRDGSQDVEVEILSISRAGPGLFGKTLWPFIGKMQSNFFQQQLDHLSQCGRMIDADNHGGIDTFKNIDFAEDLSH